MVLGTLLEPFLAPFAEQAREEIEGADPEFRGEKDREFGQISQGDRADGTDLRSDVRPGVLEYGRIFVTNDSSVQVKVFLFPSGETKLVYPNATRAIPLQGRIEFYQVRAQDGDIPDGDLTISEAYRETDR